MEKVKLFEAYLAESNGAIVDSISKNVIFPNSESMSLSQFLKEVRQSPEAKDSLTRRSNFGRGIEMAKRLKKEFKHKFTCRVYRSEWNYGGNLVLMISLSGESYRSRVFSYSSGDSTRGPVYSFSGLFNGTKKQSNDTVVNDWSMGTIYGSYQAISKYDEFMDDVVGVFKDYKRVNGVDFDMKDALKKFKEGERIKKQWGTLEPKISKQYDIAKANAAKVDYYIKLRMPYIDVDKKQVYYKTEEPRELRHPDEYGDSAYKKLSSKEYQNYEKAQAKISDLIENFCSKHGFEFVWAAAW